MVLKMGLGLLTHVLFYVYYCVIRFCLSFFNWVIKIRARVRDRIRIRVLNRKGTKCGGYKMKIKFFY
jgi:hypothetical protein